MPRERKHGGGRGGRPAKCFPAIIVYAEEVLSGRVGMICRFVIRRRAALMAPAHKSMRI